MDIEKMSADEIIEYLQTRSNKTLSPVLKQLQ